MDHMLISKIYQTLPVVDVGTKPGNRLFFFQYPLTYRDCSINKIDHLRQLSYKNVFSSFTPPPLFPSESPNVSNDRH